MATWQKVITSGSVATLAEVTASAGFSGDGSGLTGISADSLANNLTVDDSTVALDSGTTFNGSAAVTISVKDAGITLAKQANLAADKIIGRANGAGTGVPTALTATQVRTILNVADGANANVSGDNGNAAIYDNSGTPAFKSGITKAEVLTLINVADGATTDQDLSGLALKTQISGAFTAGEGIDISSGAISGENATVTNKGIASFDTNHFSVSAGAVTIKAGSIQTGDIENDAVTGAQLANDITIANDLTVTGDLLVSGDTVTVNTANLNVEDQFILINSGSSTATNESGIIFGGSNGAVGAGAALVWNGDYNGNDGRLAVANAVNWNASSATVSYSVAGVFEGSITDAATAQADHNGNIRIESNEIYIYA